MKKYLKLLPIILILLSCTDSIKDNKDTISETRENLNMGDMPNDQTKYDTIYTTNSVDNSKLINELKLNLETAQFNFEERKSRGGLSYYNCEKNRVKLVKGNGVREYFARSKKPEKGTKDFYPDFVIWVYEFSTNEIAIQNFDILEKALSSAGRFCNGKSPEKLVINGNEIFHLGTRAEMFRTYTEKYGEMIKNFH